MHRLVPFLFLALAFPLQSQTFIERGIEFGRDDAEQVDSVVLLSDFTLNAGSRFGSRSYFGLHFRNIPFEQNMEVQEVRIRFVVASDSVDEVILRIGLEANPGPTDYRDTTYNLTQRGLVQRQVFWPVRNVKRGDTLITPDLSAMVTDLLPLQPAGRAFADLSFIFGPEWAVNDTGVTELEVFSVNQSDQGRAPRFFMTADNISASPSPTVSPLHVYPVPARDAITVSWPGHPQATLRIMDLAGREVLTSTFGGNDTDRLETGHLPAGNYVLELRDGSAIAHRQLVITGN